jgi:biopolymer transport protein ExbD
VLLIIFMVLTPTMLKHMTANVPRKDESSQQDVAAAPIVLEVTAKSELSLNMEPVAAEALGDKVGERLKHDRQKVVFFKVDDEAPYGDVVKFMDIVKGAGAKTLGRHHQGLSSAGAQPRKLAIRCRRRLQSWG